MMAPIFSGAQTVGTLSVGAGFRAFAPRLEREGARFRYSRAITLEMRADRPLSRRFGLTVAGFVIPSSKQRGDSAGGFVQTADAVFVGGADLGLQFRFKPQAPIYFRAGGVVQAASRYADNQTKGAWPVEPGVTIATGIDYTAAGRYNLRVQGALYFMHPRADREWRRSASSEPRPSPNRAPSIARDYAIIVAVRQGPAK
jgi:hypothetical protein